MTPAAVVTLPKDASVLFGDSILQCKILCPRVQEKALHLRRLEGENKKRKAG